MDPFSTIADAMIDFERKLEVKASWKYRVAAAAIHALEREGYVIVRKDTLDTLATEAQSALSPDQKHFLHTV